MKKYIFAAAVAMLLAAMPLTAYADNDTAEETAAVTETAETQAATEKPEKLLTEDGTYTYSVDEDGNVKLHNFNVQGHMGEVVIPSEIDGKPVAFIGSKCFLNAFNITSVVIPATVEDMGGSVFFGCTSLEKIVVEEGNPYYSATEDGVLLGDDEKFLVCYPAGRTDETYTIPNTVDELAPSSFAYTKHLKTVEIPDSVGYIDAWAFGYSGIEKVTVPGSVVQIDDYCFAYCKDLSDVTFEDGVEKIYSAAFAFCSSLTEVEFPESVTLIGQYAFCGTGMQSVTIPSTVEEIQFCAFGYDENLSPIRDFVIYGEPNSFAQSYCTANDSENDYQNNFTFISLQDPEPTIGMHNTPNSGDSGENDANSEETPDETAPDNQLMVGLAVCGGVVLVLAAVLIVLLVKKPKTKETKDKGEEK